MTCIASHFASRLEQFCPLSAVLCGFQAGRTAGNGQAIPARGFDRLVSGFDSWRLAQPSHSSAMSAMTPHTILGQSDIAAPPRSLQCPAGL